MEIKFPLLGLSLDPPCHLVSRAGLGDLVGEAVRIARACGVNAQVKVAGIVAGMIGRAGQHR